MPQERSSRALLLRLRRSPLVTVPDGLLSGSPKESVAATRQPRGPADEEASFKPRQRPDKEEKLPFARPSPPRQAAKEKEERSFFFSPRGDAVEVQSGTGDELSRWLNEKLALSDKRDEPPASAKSFSTSTSRWAHLEPVKKEPEPVKEAAQAPGDDDGWTAPSAAKAVEPTPPVDIAQAVNTKLVIEPVTTSASDCLGGESKQPTSPQVAALSSSTSRWAHLEPAKVDRKPVKEVVQAPEEDWVAPSLVKRFESEATVDPATTSADDWLAGESKPQINPLLASHSSSSSRWATPSEKPAVKEESVANPLGISIRGAAAAKAVEMQRQGSIDSTASSFDMSRRGSADSSSFSGSASTAPSSLASSRGPSPTDMRRSGRFRKAASSSAFSGSTARPGKAGTAVFSSASHTSQQTAALLGVIEDSINDDSPFLSAAAAQYLGNIKELNLEQLRRASGGPPLPRIPREVIDAKIRELRAKHRQRAKNRRVEEGLSTISESDSEEETVAKINYEEERIRYAAIKLAYIEAIRAADGNVEDRASFHERERSPTRRSNLETAKTSSRDEKPATRAARDYVAVERKETGWGNDTTEDTKANEGWQGTTDKTLRDGATTLTTADDGKERGWGENTTERTAVKDEWDGLTGIKKEELPDLPRSPKKQQQQQQQQQQQASSPSSGQVETGWSMTPLVPADDAEEW